jgi:hypothetical protein
MRFTARKCISSQIRLVDIFKTNGMEKKNTSVQALFFIVRWEKDNLIESIFFPKREKRGWKLKK